MQVQLAVKPKAKLTQNENSQKMHFTASKDILYKFRAHCRQETKKKEIAATLVLCHYSCVAVCLCNPDWKTWQLSTRYRA